MNAGCLTYNCSIFLMNTLENTFHLYNYSPMENLDKYFIFDLHLYEGLGVC